MTTKALVSATSNKSLSLYNKILSKFPLEHVTFCFAYGSGVFKQSNTVLSSTKMIDFLISVDHPQKWHELNLKLNKAHYSGMCYFGASPITQLQQNLASKVYFNSMVPVEGVEIKYGVIAHDDLVTDLLDWNYLYSSGRLHKPVQIIQAASSSDLITALRVNLHSAVHAALLLLPEYFTEAQLYRTITALSYTGDFRMTFGEDKNKVYNIVDAQLPKFRELYQPVLKTLSDFVVIQTDEESHVKEGDVGCSQDISPNAKHYHLNQLPRTPQRRIVRYWNHSTNKRQDTEDVLRAMAHDSESGHILQNILAGIVWDSSVKQSLKGILTAGVLTSIKYSARKIKKMFQSRGAPVV